MILIHILPMMTPIPLFAKASFKSIFCVIALVDAFQHPVITAFHTLGDLAQAQLFQLFKFFHGLVPEIGNTITAPSRNSPAACA